MRLSEIYNLIRQNVNLKKGFPMVEDGKTEPSNRKIRLQEKALKMLEARIDKFSGEYLFPKGETDNWEATYQLNRQHREMLEQTGLKFRMHDLRHPFATRILKDGKTDLC